MGVHRGFAKSDRRPSLQRRLEAFFEALDQAGLGATVYVDGSFVTAVPEPGDVDLILELPKGHEWAATLRPAQYNLLSKRRVKARYDFDLLVAPAGSEALREYVEFFAQVRGRPGLRKGILRVRR